jgi:hypothetical protein
MYFFFLLYFEILQVSFFTNSFRFIKKKKNLKKILLWPPLKVFLNFHILKNSYQNLKLKALFKKFNSFSLQIKFGESAMLLSCGKFFNSGGVYIIK